MDKHIVKTIIMNKDIHLLLEDKVLAEISKIALVPALLYIQTCAQAIKLKSRPNISLTSSKNTSGSQRAFFSVPISVLYYFQEGKQMLDYIAKDMLAVKYILKYQPVHVTMQLINKMSIGKTREVRLPTTTN